MHQHVHQRLTQRLVNGCVVHPCVAFQNKRHFQVSRQFTNDFAIKVEHIARPSAIGHQTVQPAHRRVRHIGLFLVIHKIQRRTFHDGGPLAKHQHPGQSQAAFIGVAVIAPRAQ
jgi:hypothetical protein